MNDPTKEMFEKTILSFLNAAVGTEKTQLFSDIDPDAFRTFVKEQQIEVLFITGLVKAGHMLSKQEKNILIQNTIADNWQTETAEGLFGNFSRNMIDHMPLKGCILKPLYPSSELRSMGDIDILIRTDQYDRIRPLMLAEGFTEQEESDHEYIWEKDGMLVELHKRLIPSYNKDYYAYFGDGWQLAKPCKEGSRYEMSPEDTFIYLFTHFAKHYRDAGAGIRQVLDLYVYRKAYPDMDENYITGVARQLQLDRFYENVMHMIRVWFAGEKHTEASLLISDRLFASGVFGNTEDSDRSAMLKKKNAAGSIARVRILAWIYRIFLPYEKMTGLYPELKKIPVLLPFCWIRRALDIVTHKRERFQYYTDQDKKVGNDDVEAYRDMLHRSGLDFNFK